MSSVLLGPLIPTLNSVSTQFQVPALNQNHPQSPLPALLPTSLPYTSDYRDYGPSCSQSQSQSQCLPTEVQHIEWHSFTKLESRLLLSLMVQSPQEVYDVLAPNLSEDWAVSIFPNNFPINCELWEKLEQHIQKWSFNTYGTFLVGSKNLWNWCSFRTQ